MRESKRTEGQPLLPWSIPIRDHPYPRCSGIWEHQADVLPLEEKYGGLGNDDVSESADFDLLAADVEDVGGGVFGSFSLSL